MVPGLDSAYPPTLDNARRARADGIRVWGGYLPGPRLLHGWSDEEIRRVQSAGLVVVAYCSGWANPHTIRAQAARLGVLACLDVEGGIRGDGPWVQQWLRDSGAGLYGNGPVHKGRVAPFHQLAAYPGHDPHATWGEGYPVPLAPHGWQWRGSHPAYGVTVDSAWWDDWFARGGDEAMTDGDIAALREGAQLRRDGQPIPDNDHPVKQLGWQLANCGAIAGKALVDSDPAGQLPEHQHTPGGVIHGP